MIVFYLTGYRFKFKQIKHEAYLAGAALSFLLPGTQPGPLPTVRHVRLL
jgi:hypothetical protein